MIAALLGGWEIVLILSVVLILFGAKRLPDVRSGCEEGWGGFWKGLKDSLEEVDEAAHDAGRSLGGIYGKPAAEALGSDNQVAELYDPAALKDSKNGEGILFRVLVRILARFVAIIWRLRAFLRRWL